MGKGGHEGVLSSPAGGVTSYLPSVTGQGLETTSMVMESVMSMEPVYEWISASFCEIVSGDAYKLIYVKRVKTVPSITSWLGLGIHGDASTL